MQRANTSYIPRVHILDGVEDPQILPDTTKSQPQPCTKDAVGDDDIGAIGFERDGIITVGDVPAVEGDFVRVDGVRAVRVAGSCAVVEVRDVDIF